MESPFKNFWFHLSLILLLIIAGETFYFTSIKKCPVCPEEVTTHSVRIDTLYVKDTIASSKTKLTKVIPVKESNRLQPVVNCDSLRETHESMYQYETDLSDTFVEGYIKQTICRNRIVFTEKKFKYLIPHLTDTTIQFVDRPIHKNTFTLGAILSKYSSAVTFGYRSNRVHGAIGYDLSNKQPVVQINYDLK